MDKEVLTQIPMEVIRKSSYEKFSRLGCAIDNKQP